MGMVYDGSWKRNVDSASSSQTLLFHSAGCIHQGLETTLLQTSNLPNISTYFMHTFNQEIDLLGRCLSCLKTMTRETRCKTLQAAF